MSGGLNGEIGVVQETDANTYAPLANIRTRPGGRTSAFVQEQERIYVPLPAKKPGDTSQLQVYETVR